MLLTRPHGDHDTELSLDMFNDVLCNSYDLYRISVQYVHITSTRSMKLNCNKPTDPCADILMLLNFRTDPDIKAEPL